MKLISENFHIKNFWLAIWCVCVCASARVCACVCARVHAYVCVCACTRMCMHVCVYVMYDKYFMIQQLTNVNEPNK